MIELIDSLNSIKYFFVRLYLKIFKPEKIIKIGFNTPKPFKTGEIIISGNKDTDLLHIGKNQFVLPKRKMYHRKMLQK